MKKTESKKNENKVVNVANDMKVRITGCKVFPIKNPKGYCKAMCTLFIDNMFAITGFKLVETNDSIFVSYPSTWDGKDNYDTFFLCNFDKDERNAFNDWLTEYVNEEFRKVVK